MGSVNVGNMAARLGLDPSEFLDKMRGVQGFNGLISEQMGREWKKTGRDGAEVFRTLDEMIGIHLNRPMTRLLVDTFPGFAKGLQSILGGVAFGAVGFAATELFERVSKGMEEAKKKEEEYTEAVQKTKLVLGETDAASEQRMDKALAKAAALRGDMKGEAHFKGLVADSEAVDQTAKAVDKLVEAELREARANQARMGFWAAAGGIMHTAFSFDSTLQIEKTNDSLEEFGREFDIKSVEDQIHHTATAASYLADEIKRAHKELDDLKNAPEAPEVMFQGDEAITYSAKPDPKVSAAAQKKADTLDAIAEAERRRKAAADQEKENERVEAGKRHADELRSEIEQLKRLGQTSEASASSALLLAAATGKGTAASIQAAAAAEAEKKILDMRAEANTKLFGDTHKPVGDDKRVQQMLAENAVIERRNALIINVSKAIEEFNRKLGESKTQDDERIAALNVEATATSKVAVEQAKELAKLVPLREELQQLKLAYDALSPAAKAGPAGQAIRQDLDAGAGRLNAETANKTNVVLPGIQAGAFQEELNKIRDEIGKTAREGESGFKSIDDQVQEATRHLADLSGNVPAAIVERLRKEFTELAETKVDPEFIKLGEKIREARIETAAWAAGSPFAKLDAEALKLGFKFHMMPAEIARARQELIQLQAIENAGKAFERVDALNPAGGKMQELSQQVADLREMQAEWEKVGRDVAPIKLAIQEITEEEDKILLKTGGIGAGFKAWADGLQQVKSEGEFTFELLTQATKGFEDDAVKSFLAILETERGGHQKLVKELRTMWAGFFNSLASMALKHQLENLLKAGAAKLPGKAGEQMTKVFGAGKDAATSANTTALGTNTAALNALTSRISTSAGGIGGGIGIPGISGGGAGGDSGGFGDAGNFGGNVAEMASGTDFFAGGPTWVGEQGPEILNLPRGSQITPNDVATKPAGGGDSHYYDQRGAVVTEDLMRRGEAARMMAHTKGQAVREAVANMDQIRRRTLQAR